MMKLLQKQIATKYIIGLVLSNMKAGIHEQMTVYF